MIPIDVKGITSASHTPVVRIEAWQGTTLVDASFQRHGTSISLASDQTRWPRHELRMRVGGLDLAPADAGDLLVPGETQFRVFLGVMDGAVPIEERVATLWLDESVVSRSREASVEVVAYSLEARVSQAGFHSGDLQPYPGEDAPTLIARLIRHGMPSAVVNVLAGAGRPVPADLGLSGGLWDSVEDVARIAHLSVGVNRLGEVDITEPPVLGVTPAYVLATGPGGTLVETETRLTREGAANRARIAYRSTEPDQPDVVGVATHTTGPVRWDGPAGRLLYTDTRDGPVTQAQADQAALDALGQRLGYIRTTTLTASPDPRVEVGDTVEVRLASGSTERHLVTAVSRDLIPAGPMRLETRGDYLAGAP